MKTLFRSFLVTYCFLMAAPAYSTTYYINSSTGSDGNNGTSESTPWQTLTNINTVTFQPGDSILFRAGQFWTGTIMPQGSGSSGNPIVIGRYGAGDNPALHGDGTVDCSAQSGFIRYCTISLHNQEYWIIRDLEVTNFDASEESGTLAEWESDNVTDYVEVTEPAPYTGTNTRKAAILVQGNDIGELNQIHLINLEVHGVNGDISVRDNGGIYFRVFNEGSDTPTYFNDVLIDSSYIHDVDRVGIFNTSDYDNRTATTNTDWTPSQNFIVRNTTIRRTGGNGAILRVSENPLIEHSLFDYCAIKTTGNAVYFYNTDGGVLQYNESRYTKANQGDADAGGLDSDYKSRNTIIQYNYSHDNDFGMLVTGGPGSFNDGTIVRYNIIENDGLIARDGVGKWAFRLSGTSTNTIVHNNIIYLGSGQSSTRIVYHRDWGGDPDHTYYYNNIFYNDASGSSYDLVNSTNHLFSYNVYYGNAATSEPSDIKKIVGDPLLANPGGGETGYTVGSASSTIGAGIRLLSSTPNKDYYDNDILTDAPIDVGVDQVSLDNVQIYTVNEDAFVRAGTYATTNFGSDLLLKVKGTVNSDFIRYSLLKFDLTDYEYSSISSATLYLFGSAEEVINVDVYKVDSDSWDEGSVTWNTKPTFSSYIGNFGVEMVNQWYQIDVTDAVQSELNADDIVSFGLKDDAELVNVIDFLSKDNTPTYFHPYLSIVEGLRIPVAQDSYVRGGAYDDDNFGSDTVLVVKNSPTMLDNDRITYLNFDISSIDGTVEQAILHFTGSVLDEVPYSLSANETSDSWSEGSITWNNAPSATASLGSINVTAASYENYQLDITDYVTDESGGDDEVSILLQDETEANSRLYIRSSESGIDIPYIEIIYESE